jgi:hypothetical protein
MGGIVERLLGGAWEGEEMTTTAAIGQLGAKIDRLIEINQSDHTEILKHLGVHGERLTAVEERTDRALENVTTASAACSDSVTAIKAACDKRHGRWNGVIDKLVYSLIWGGLGAIFFAVFKGHASGKGL